MQDFLLDTDLDVLVEAGDFVTGESTDQHQHLLLVANKGDFKENPTICVGVAGWLKDDEPGGLLSEIKKEFERDGMTVRQLLLTEGKLTTNAGY